MGRGFGLPVENTVGEVEAVEENLPDSEYTKKLKDLLIGSEVSPYYINKLGDLINEKFGDSEDLKTIFASENLTLKFKEEIVYDLKIATNETAVNEVRLKALIGYALNKVEKVGEQEKIEIKTEELEDKQEELEDKGEKLENFNKLTTELVDLVDLKNSKYANLVKNAENEVLKTNPNLKEEIGEEQFQNYVYGATLLLNEATFIKDNPNKETELKQKLSELRQNANEISDLCNIPALKETTLKNYFEKNPEYTTKAQEAVKRVVMKTDIKGLSIKSDGSSTKFILTNKNNKQEIIEVRKDGSISGTMEIDNFPIETPVTYTGNEKLYDERRSETIKTKKLRKQLKTKEALKGGFESKEQINSSIKKLENRKEKNKETLSYSETLSELEISSTDDIPAKKEELTKELSEIEKDEITENFDEEDIIRDKLNIIEEYENLKKREPSLLQEQREIEEDLKVLEEIGKSVENKANYDEKIDKDNIRGMKEVDEARAEGSRKLDLLHSIHTTLIPREMIDTPLGNIVHSEHNFHIFSFDKANFGITGTMEKGNKTAIYLLNKLLTGSIDGPIDLKKEPMAIYGVLDRNTKLEIRRIINAQKDKGDLDHFIRTNLQKGEKVKDEGGN